MKGKARPLIIPVFIAHQGCPHRCVFCDQRAITASPARAPAVGAAETEATVRAWLARSRRRGRRVEVAFYGGSFTALDVGRQRELLKAVRPFLERGEVDGVRVSTRPDCIDAPTVRRLRRGGVAVVELGVQSLDDGVLALAGRGHGGEEVERAMEFLAAGGMVIGAQLMLGLPGDTTAKALDGAGRLIALGPDFVRLYPVLVLAGTPLAGLYAEGRYAPLSLPRAVALAARMVESFEMAAVPVIRLGLPPSPELEAALVAGPYHPAFGELVRARVLFRRLRRDLARRQGPCRVRLTAAETSLLHGRRGCMKNRLARLGLLHRLSAAPSPGRKANRQLRRDIR